MEGVGARMGRSSSRYGNGSSTVFSGPVRKWKKDWVPIPPPLSSSNSSNRHHLHLPSSSSPDVSIVGPNGSLSRLCLFKWTPVSQSSSDKENSIINVNTHINDTTDKDAEPPRKKFKYIPIAVLEERKKEVEENSDDEVMAGRASRDDRNEKPDINDVPMEENLMIEEEKQTAVGRQDLNKSLDLSL